MAKYCSAANLLRYYRPKVVADLVADDGAPPSRLDLTTDTNLSEALDAASGEIDAALVEGKRYSTEDLEGLTGNSAALLRKICAALAMVTIYDRSPAFNSQERDRNYKYARKYLDRLAEGDDVFDLDAVRGAGLPTTDGPTSSDYGRINSIRDATRRYYPPRHIPTDRG